MRIGSRFCIFLRKSTVPIIFALILSLSGCGSNGSRSESSGSDVTGRTPEYTEFSELKGKTLSMLTGAPFEELILSKVPEVKEFTYYASMPDMTLAVKSGKTDAALTNNALSELAVNREESLALFPTPLKEASFGIAFSKENKNSNPSKRCG